MARIEGVPAERAGWFIRLAYWIGRRRYGRFPTPATVAAHDPPIFFAVAGYELALERAKRVDVRLKALASIKTASLIGCVF